MSLIKRPNEIERPKHVRVMIYGQSGTGKTTFAVSSEKTLLLDFDGGVHRLESQHRTPVVQMHNFKDALEALQEDLSDYNTVVVDTIGKMLDYIVVHVCGQKQPRIQDWGRINQTFSDFNRTLYHSGKNIIYVAHRDVRREGDENVFVPALREKSYSSIVADIDLLGYLEMTEGGRTLTFNPSTRNDGKNTCRLPDRIYIPNVSGKQNESLNDLILKPYKEVCLAMTKAEAAFAELMEEIDFQIASISDAASANEFILRIDTFKHVGNSKVIAAQKVKRKCADVGLKFNSELKIYE